jgi:hypothetical protein
MSVNDDGLGAACRVQQPYTAGEWAKYCFFEFHGRGGQFTELRFAVPHGAPNSAGELFDTA